MESVDVNWNCPQWMMQPNVSSFFSGVLQARSYSSNAGSAASSAMSKTGPYVAVYHSFLDRLKTAEFVSGINNAIKRSVDKNMLFQGEKRASSSSFSGDFTGFKRAVIVTADFADTSNESAVKKFCRVLTQDIPQSTPVPDLLVFNIRSTTETMQTMDRIEQLVTEHKKTPQAKCLRNLSVIVLFSY
jgi:hypothetical protein